MTSTFEDLYARFIGELDDLEFLVVKMMKAWQLAKTSPVNQDMFLDSVALNLHGFYSGVESLLLEVARHIDRSIPEGPDWHAQLLSQMSTEGQGRPAMLSSAHKATLDELRRFRHLVRNVYAFNLNPERVEPLVAHLGREWPSIKAELSAFARVVETAGQVAEAADSDSCTSTSL